MPVRLEPTQRSGTLAAAVNPSAGMRDSRICEARDGVKPYA